MALRLANAARPQQALSSTAGRGQALVTPTPALPRPGAAASAPRPRLLRCHAVAEVGGPVDCILLAVWLPAPSGLDSLVVGLGSAFRPRVRGRSDA
jgi:hypothetical protein